MSTSSAYLILRCSVSTIANEPGRAANHGLSGYVTHWGDQDEVPGSWPQNRPAWATVVIWGVKQQTERELDRERERKYLCCSNNYIMNNKERQDGEHSSCCSNLWQKTH